MGCQLLTIAGPTHGIDDVTNVANQQRLNCIAYTAAPAGAAAAAPSLCIFTAASYGSSGGPGPIDLYATHMFLPMRPDSGKNSIFLTLLPLPVQLHATGSAPTAANKKSFCIACEAATAVASLSPAPACITPSCQLNLTRTQCETHSAFYTPAAAPAGAVAAAPSFCFSNAVGLQPAAAAVVSLSPGSARPL
jgi:hypothetical protein